ncbi:threonine--tRNA ligase [Mollicutes bacterium LVI A0039]|nr:threonine--tRNA ligase [Mollicutes bacterium LVI A0039]
MVNIKFPDGNVKQYEKGIKVIEVAKDISISLAKKVVAAKLDDVLVDGLRAIESDCAIELILEGDETAFEVLNHSTAHLMAQAIKNLYPEAKFGVGPNIENGYYYDFDIDVQLSESDLQVIEKEMKRIVKTGQKIERHEMSYDEAKEFFKNDEYKLELIDKIQDRDEVISVYSQGDFTDLCRGAHLMDVKKIKNFKLTSVAGAYWLGDSDNKMLQRIYGTSWWSAQELADYLHMIEEAKKRDHRKLGKELDLFFMSEYGPGFPFFLPNGMVVKNELLAYWNEVHARENYEFIQTPMMLNKELWEVSGHWFNYRENMYTSEIDKHEFAIKPMNCPGGMLVYKNKMHSYKEFPIKMAELGTVHRHEASGALHGLFRVRVFTQDDAHIFMREDQIEQEVIKLIELYSEIYSKFGLDFHIELSTKPEKAIGTPEAWEFAEAALASACDKSGHEYILNPGDGAFYGPKLDFKLRDSIGRIWQCGTIQLDNNLPERFDLTYIAEDGSKKRPVMLHRALLGSIERFIGVITEHFAGAFPTWLAPTQVRILPVSLSAHKDYVTSLERELVAAGVRVILDEREEKLNYKIREAQVMKTPYTLIIGDSEMEENKVTYRPYGTQDNITVTKDEFISNITKEIKDRI